MTDSNGGSSERGRDGRFAKGNPGGPGNPRVRTLAAHQAAVREAVSPADLGRVLHRLRDLALDGDVAAARVLLERVVGKVRQEPAAPAPWQFDTEEIQSEAGRRAAIKSVLTAVAAGELAPQEAEALVGFIRLATDSLPSEHLAFSGL